MGHVVGVPADIVVQRAQQSHAIFSTRERDDFILCAMSQKDRGVLIGGMAFFRKRINQRDIAGQPDDAAQFFREAQAGIKCHGATLREAGKQYPVIRYAAFSFLFDQAGDETL